MKTVILVMTEHQTAENRGRMAHALNMASALKEAGVEFRMVFAGKSVEWLPQFLNEDRASEHPFVGNYADHFDRVRDHVQSCNFCNKRFDTYDAFRYLTIEPVRRRQRGVTSRHSVSRESWIAGRSHRLTVLD